MTGREKLMKKQKCFTEMIDDYVNGYIERRQGGRYEGKITIDGVLLPSISAVFFTNGNENYLWLKRKKILEYDSDTQSYHEREAKPQWEAYLRKQVNNNTVAYKGDFFFLHYGYTICGVWDKVFGVEKQRLNLYVERKPMGEQTIINAINKKTKK